MRWYQSFGNISPRALRVWQRDAEVFRTTIWVNFIPPLLEPVLYIIAFGFGLGSLVKTVPYHGRQIAYLTFMVPGVISVAVMFWSYFETTYASFVRMYYQRTFDAIVATPLLVEDVIAGEWLWGIARRPQHLGAPGEPAQREPGRYRGGRKFRPRRFSFSSGCLRAAGIGCQN